MSVDATKKSAVPETSHPPGAAHSARHGSRGAHDRSVHEKSSLDSPLNQLLATRGFRFTPQRQQVYQVLLEKRDHPTAEEVFMRAKRDMPDISMATVYNCLDALVKCRVVRQVTLERGATRFCPNMQEHCHFYCDHCDAVFDIDLPAEPGVPLPRGYKAERFDIAIHGRCPACASGRK